MKHPLMFALLLGITPGHASGPIMPDALLVSGGDSITGVPGFFFETELRIVARRYQDKHPELRTTVRDGNAETALAEDADFAAALAEQRLQPPDPTLARQQQTAARAFINATPEPAAPLPPEFESEFSDYHRGALAFRRGDLPAARGAFEQLLARPAAERHYRTTWALYMLARIASGTKEGKQAVERCQQVRRAVAEGFADATGCASASLRLEALHNEELAAEIMLQDLARRESAGDTFHDVRSLRSDLSQADLDRRARSQVLREIVSCQLMGGASGPFPDTAADACRRWLAAVESAGVTRTRDADRLGWVAYRAGDYAAAGRWLQLTAKPSALSLWLKAKLELRAGHREAALAAMKASLAVLPDAEFHRLGHDGGEPFTATGKAALGDAGLLQLACGDFRSAMVTFLKAKLWLDAAWVAERLMTTGELKTFVDRERPWNAAREAAALEFETAQSYDGGPLFLYCICAGMPEPVPDDYFTHRLRWLLARRLAREGRLETALKYYPPWLRADATTYQKSRANATNPKRAKADRARDWWTAAWLARTRGLELMGTEREPDNAAFAGEYDAGDARTVRLTGKFERTVYDRTDWTSRQFTETVDLPTTRAERTRLQTLPQPHTQRWHYRITAADHAWHAARLLPNRSEELADVLNSGGRWAASMASGEKLSQKFYDAIEARCPETELGRKVLAAKNFTSDPGPWSGPLMAERAARKKATRDALEARYRSAASEPPLPPPGR